MTLQEGLVMKIKAEGLGKSKTGRRRKKREESEKFKAK